MTTPPEQGPVDRHGETQHQARMRLTRLPDGTESGFVALVPRGSNLSPANTVNVTDAFVDYDADGNVMGLSWLIAP